MSVCVCLRSKLGSSSYSTRVQSIHSTMTADDGSPEKEEEEEEENEKEWKKRME